MSCPSAGWFRPLGRLKKNLECPGGHRASDRDDGGGALRHCPCLGTLAATQPEAGMRRSVRTFRRSRGDGSGLSGCCVQQLDYVFERAQKTLPAPSSPARVLRSNDGTSDGGNLLASSWRRGPAGSRSTELGNGQRSRGHLMSVLVMNQQLRVPVPRNLRV